MVGARPARGTGRTFRFDETTDGPRQSTPRAGWGCMRCGRERSPRVQADFSTSGAGGWVRCLGQPAGCPFGPAAGSGDQANTTEGGALVSKGKGSVAGEAAGGQALTSLHQRILTDIQDNILSGRWEPGQRIPVEQELMLQYQCSRMTVNKVLTQLSQAGIIERRRKVGSFVSRPQSQSAVLSIRDIKDEVTALGLPYRFEILERHKRRATREDRELLGADAPVPVLELVCRHFAKDLPFCVEYRLINLKAVESAASEAFDEISPGAWLLRKVPWNVAEHRIRASGPDPAVAALLKIRRGSPCLIVERTTRSMASPVTFVRLTYPGNLHQLVATFTELAPVNPATAERRLSDESA